MAADARRKLTMADIRAAAARLRNWGRWGPTDELGTLNHTRPEDVLAATRCVRTGRVHSLALPYDSQGPQGGKSNYPALGRFNPIHVMLRTGTDAYAGALDHRKIRASDDIVIMAMQCGTQWDSLAHVFYENSMWNGYDCRNVTSNGAAKCGIEKTREKMVGRGVLFDIARMVGLDALPDGFAVGRDLLDRAEAHFGVEVGRGDYLLVRTGHMECKLADGNWDGYSGGDAPGLAFDTLDWMQDKQIAAVATDTWGVEVRPCETDAVNMPLHWIAIPIMGLTLGEIFYLKELAEACAADGHYDFLFVAPALPVTGAVGSPVNPLAIR